MQYTKLPWNKFEIKKYTKLPWNKISQNDTFFCHIILLHNFSKYFSGTRVYEIVNNCLAFVIFIYKSVRNYVHKTFAQWRNRWCWKSVIRMFQEIWHCEIFWYCRFQNHILVISLWFVKYEFSTKIWFVKTSTWIVKYESRVVKLNPAHNNIHEKFNSIFHSFF